MLSRRGSLVLALGLACGLLAGPVERSARAERGVDAPAVRLEVREGAARLASVGGERLVLRREPAVALEDGARVDVPVSGRVRLTLACGATLDLVGPARVAVEDGQASRLVLERLGELEFQGRGRGPELVLARGQVLRPAHCAFRLEGRSADAIDFELRAGDGVELDLGGRYPFRLAGARRIRIPARLDGRP